MARSKARVYTCCALTVLLVVALIVCIAVLVRRKCPDGTFLNAAVAADSRKCSEVARDILQRGGSAVDGAIAALLCTSVVNPQSMGIGGGSIFTVMDRSGNVKIINSRETVPKKFKSDLLKSCSSTWALNSGSQWIGVPGEIRGYEQAHRLYGKLPWATLFQPTIQMAREGFPLPQVQSRYISYIDRNETQALRKLYSNNNGNLLKTGDIVKFEKLADTLEMIANQGADAFYTGRVAENLVRDIQEAGGTLTMQDLAAYKVTVTDAWVVPLGEYQMYIPPPPAGGVLLSLILNIMKGYHLNSASLTGEQKALAYHRYVEAFIFANGLKKHVRDPQFGSEARSRVEVEPETPLLIRLPVTMARSKAKCPAGTFLNAAVAADSRKCSEVARDILQRGGSAVDGAIAALLCTSVVNPQSMGIGGGSIFTVMDRSGNVKIINSRETVPKKFKSDLLKSCSSTSALNSGSQWIGVPGEIRGYEQAHRLYGKLPWATLFQPTIQMAREGFPLPQVQSRYISYIDRNETQALRYKRKLYSNNNGNLLKTGDIVKFEKLADTLEMIANQGADAFYTGRVAENLVRDIQEAGGTLTMQDLAAYKVTVTDAWVVPLGEYQMYIPPPPAGGVLLSLILNIMKGYHLNSASLTGEQKALAYHRYVEAFKFANGLKKHVRDPQFGSEAMAKKFIEDSFADHIRSLISSDRTHDLQYYNVTPYLDGTGTTHVSVLAEDGSAVSVTSTINHIFGSKVFSPSTGVILNNELSDFCGRVDNIFPGEQPPSSMAPAVLKSQSKTLVIGSSGGSMITTGISSMLMNHLWFGKSLKDAIAAPVIFVNSQNALKFEPGFDKNVMEALKALGHKRETGGYFYNVVNAVEKEGGCISAVSDARKQGEAAGY